jgi:hypothetical protein
MLDLVQDAWHLLATHWTPIATFVGGSILSPVVTFAVQRRLKRLRINVEVKRIHARFENIFRAGYYETALAEIRSNDRASGLGHFLTQYIEFTLTLENVTKATVGAVILESASKRDEIHELLVPLEFGFEALVRPVIEENVSRTFCVDEASISFPVETLQRIVVRDTLGNLHQTRKIRNIDDLDARREPHPIGEVLSKLALEPEYKLKQSASWLGFGLNCEGIGWHVGARLTPENGTAYQPAFDDAEAARLTEFIRQLPGFADVQYLTVNDGVIIANADLSDKNNFYHSASCQMHVSDSGIVELCLRGPGDNDLTALFSALAIVWATARYVWGTRMTWPKQRLRVGYAGVTGKAFKHLPEPGADRGGNVDLMASEFGPQVADVVVDILRDGHGPLRDRTAVLDQLNTFWKSSFPAGLVGLPIASPSREGEG